MFIYLFIMNSVLVYPAFLVYGKEMPPNTHANVFTNVFTL